MKILDMHIHAVNTAPDPAGLLSKMEEAGVYGGCIFCNWPYENNKKIGTSFDERLHEVLSWTEGYEDRLFPVMWIHPEEKNIEENVHKAAEAGICGFKMICNNYYVYEEKPMRVLEEIAKTGKGVFFHTGILWDGQVSSNYNRPINWESLIGITGLKFAMGHCSWPWVDECIAMYGKFLNSLLRNVEASEMFFDTTPGTPEIYREELLTKLFTIGYDVGKNIMFGSDCHAHNYKPDWVKKWLETDKRIMDKLEVRQDIREDFYYNNVLRFLGKSDEKVTHKSPSADDSNAWSCK